MKENLQNVPSDRAKADQMVIQGEPDVLKRPIVGALRQSLGVAKPPEIMKRGFPNKRPLCERVILDDRRVIVEDETVAERPHIDESGYQQHSRQHYDLRRIEAPAEKRSSTWLVRRIVASQLLKVSVHCQSAITAPFDAVNRANSSVTSGWAYDRQKGRAPIGRPTGHHSFSGL